MPTANTVIHNTDRGTDPLTVTAFQAAAGGVLEPGWRYTDWTEEHRNLFTAIHIEKQSG